jgi:phage/plasmid-like protein (TIGR03299 family)
MSISSFIEEIIMAHLIETMAYIGQTPWHGLGHALPAHQPLEVWAQQAGMDWRILEAPVRYLAGESGNLGQILSAPEHKVLFRSDTQAPLSVVSQRYRIVQPREILEFYRDLSDVAGFELETAGVLKGGRKCWALARTGQSGTLKGKDRTEAYVLLATACDGTMATTAQFTSIRVVCNNTLAVATAGAVNAVKVRHNTTFDAQAVKRQLGISVSAWDSFMYRLKVLADRRVKPAEAKAYFDRVFALPTGSPANPSHKPQERNVDQALALFGGLGRGAELPSAKGTAYGLLNAVTELVDHHRRARSADHRLDSAWFGAGASIKQRAMEEALQLAA